MMRMSKKVEYALIGLLHMSQKDHGQLTTTKELAQTYHIPQQLMGKVLQQLARRRIIRSVQGVKGGYRIHEPIYKISLTQVYDAIEGPMKIVSCIYKKNRLICEQRSFCIIKNPMEVMQEKIEKLFGQLTLEDLRKEVFQNFHQQKKVQEFRNG